MKKIFITLFIILSFICFVNSQQIYDSAISNSCNKESYIENWIDLFKRENSALLNRSTIIDNKVDIKEQVQFLNEEFNTSIFNNHKFISWSDLGIYKKDTLICHLGIAEIRFSSTDDCLIACKTIKESGKRKFNTLVWTEFKYRKIGNYIYLFLSETPLQKEIMEYLNKVETIDFPPLNK